MHWTESKDMYLARFGIYTLRKGKKKMKEKNEFLTYEDLVKMKPSPGRPVVIVSEHPRLDLKARELSIDFVAHDQIFVILNSAAWTGYSKNILKHGYTLKKTPVNILSNETFERYKSEWEQVRGAHQDYGHYLSFAYDLEKKKNADYKSELENFNEFLKEHDLMESWQEWNSCEEMIR